MERQELIALLESQIENPARGLPEEVFLFLTRLTPMINVDLLVTNELGHTLLTWREDEHHGKGWHIPGGIIRFRETPEERIRQVAKNELGTEVIAEKSPCAIHTFIVPEQRNRSHFISLLYRCRLQGNLPAQVDCGQPQPGAYRWFSAAPDDLLPAHAAYRHYIGEGK